jgi:hypothetical protein
MQYRRLLLVVAVTFGIFAFGTYVYLEYFAPRETLPPDETWEFQFGRGSGWHGLDLLRITSDGRSEFEFQTDVGAWQRKTFVVPNEQIDALRQKINALGILDLDKTYHGNVQDGTQWCLLIKTEGKARSFYFDILAPFAEPVAGVRVPTRHHRQHEKEIWASIR